MTSFKNRLISLRNEKGLTQEQFAKALGISKSAVSMYENGNRTPSFELEEKIADFYNVDLEYLRGRSDVKNATYLDYLQDRDFSLALESLEDNLLHYEKLNNYDDYIIYDNKNNEIACLNKHDIINLYRKHKTLNKKVLNSNSVVLTAARDRKYIGKLSKLDERKRKIVEDLIDSYFDELDDEE